MTDDMKPTDEEVRFEGRLQEFKGPKPPDSVWQGIEARIGGRRASLWPRVVFTAAAVLVIAVTVAIVALRTTRGPGRVYEARADFPASPIAEMPGDDTAFQEISLIRVSIKMSADPGKVLDYLDAHSRPLRAADDGVMSIMGTNGA